MSRRAATFTEVDLNRAMKVAERFGRDVVIGKDGSIRIEKRQDKGEKRSPYDPDGDGPDLVF
ncbi:MAG: hypothetical protein ACP5QR_04980 [Rhizomicrobium sp.]